MFRLMALGLPTLVVVISILGAGGARRESLLATVVPLVFLAAPCALVCRHLLRSGAGQAALLMLAALIGPILALLAAFWFHVPPGTHSFAFQVWIVYVLVEASVLATASMRIACLAIGAAARAITESPSE